MNARILFYFDLYAIITVSFYKCTHCKLLWMKASAKCPKCECKYNVYIHISLYIFSTLCLIQLQMANLNKEVAVSTETINTSKTELTDLNRMFQALQIELQSQLSMVSLLLPPQCCRL